MNFDHWLLDKIFTPIAVLFRYLGVDQWNLSRNTLLGGVVFIIGSIILAPSPVWVRLVSLLLFIPLWIVFLIKDFRLIQILSMSESGPLVVRDTMWSNRLVMLTFFSLGIFVFNRNLKVDDILGDIGLILYGSGHYFMAVIMPPPPPPKVKEAYAGI